MLLSCHCDVTTPKAKWDGSKASAQGTFYSEMKMCEHFTSYCCDLLHQNILILSTVLKECQRRGGEIAGRSGLGGRVWAPYEIASHKVTIKQLDFKER